MSEEKYKYGYIQGFSALSKNEKLERIANYSGINPDDFKKYSWTEPSVSEILDSLSENTVSHFSLPFGIAPNFLVNGKDYVLPFVTEESSVVAAMAKAAKIWYSRGGFKAKVLGTVKKGQVHFFWKGSFSLLKEFLPELKQKLYNETASISGNMEKRGGGITEIRILDKTDLIQDYFQLDCDFKTGDAMGANFINSVLEKMATVLEKEISEKFPEFASPEINMAILSNYTPECLVEAWVECPVSKLDNIIKDVLAEVFAHRFEKAVQISKIDVSRAVTHNKGILNGIDSLALATGNDWRAIEAGAHAFAASDGNYKGLSDVSVKNGMFRFSIKLSVNVGTVGGVTNIHPLAKTAIKILKNPSASELMQLFAVAGLASNFSAITALIGNGIQSGHMKLHLKNILWQLNASNEKIQMATSYFKNRKVGYSEVRDFLKREK
ncbi:MAG: hydroxymethylglutaryl-CoA reductase, degradative [Prolixibacteraceae bacterium]|nr:hydroxymethylglutaryl-CoA reductase, degradative [Prolixibacteraceae bacterium]MBN2775173.1 hydroxymethylglutaryl-CoA reductase, degradative [Prolixibacteraceae bacterium]